MPTNDPFSAPSSASGVEWAELDGRLLLFKVLAFEPSIKTGFGEKTAVRADVIVLDGEEAEFLDILVFPKVLQTQIKARIGGMVLGRLGKGVAKPNQKPPWKIAEASDADKAVARGYIERSADVPF